MVAPISPAMNRYERIKTLGAGTYGCAVLVKSRADKKMYVVKEIAIGHLSKEELANVQKEAAVLKDMHHSNIVAYRDSFTEGTKLYIVMDFADGGDLDGKIKERKKTGKFFSEQEVMGIFVQICLALKHVHDRRILHRDLKALVTGEVYLYIILYLL